MQIFAKGDKVETPMGAGIVRELVVHGGEFAYIVGGFGGRDVFSIHEVQALPPQPSGCGTQVKITDLHDDTSYIATSYDDCRCVTDRHVFHEVLQDGKTVSMGKVVGQLISTPQ